MPIKLNYLRVDNLQVPLGGNHKEGNPLGMVDKVPHQDSQDQGLQEDHRRDNHLGILDLRSQDQLGLI